MPFPIAHYIEPGSCIENLFINYKPPRIKKFLELQENLLSADKRLIFLLPLEFK